MRKWWRWPRPRRARPRALPRTRIAHGFADYRELLALREIDLVTLALPNDLHCAVTLAAAKAGKHVVCEKPLCRTLEEADQMIEACRRRACC